MSESDLRAQGLNIKEGDVQAPDSKLNPSLIEKAKLIQSQIPGFNYFSSFNDSWHQKNSPNSKHASGAAIDFTLSRKPTVEQGQSIIDDLNKLGFSFAQDEYNNGSTKSTGGHIHAQLSAAKGGIASGSKTGYPATLHGNEVIVPLALDSILAKLAKTPASDTMAKSSDSNMDKGSSLTYDMLQLIADKLDTVAREIDTNNTISQKILQNARA